MPRRVIVQALAARLVTSFMKLLKQKGLALIIFALILALAATAFLVSQLDGIGIKIERNKIKRKRILVIGEFYLFCFPNGI